MCGIAGWIGSETAWNATAMQAGLRRRGPDGSGVWASQQATLVHTRLAIMDLSESGAQPMTSACRASASTDAEKRDDSRSRYALVFNGEIFNFQELRSELEQQGERFVSGSDTEVLLRLLTRDGFACLSKLAGMFSFCFWDAVKQEAFLARDGFGIKPLYYRVDDGTLAFASETHVLKRSGDAVDAAALRDYFLWGTVQEPATLNTAVRQLPAGHWLRWRDGKAEICCWFDDSNEGVVGRASEESGQRNEFRTTTQASPLQDNGMNSVPRQRREGRESPLRVDPASFVQRTRDALVESVERHLVSDVPVGIFLSGGIDSTVLLALTRYVLGPSADIRTFSIGFDDPDFDESSVASRTADHFGSRHTEWRMTPADGAAEIPAFLDAMDQPTTDGFNTWCVSKLARREGMKVVLSGVGGDEFFAGYPSFVRVPQFHQLYRRLGPLRRLAARVLETRRACAPWHRLAGFLRGDGSWLEAYHAQRGFFTQTEAQKLAQAFTGELPSTVFPRSLPSNVNPRAVVSALEVSLYMRNQLLRDSDVFSMAHGLELRVPLVDTRLAAVLAAIPAEVRLRQGKKLLVEAVPEVPEWVWNQPKRGFRFPFQAWMEGQFGDLLADANAISPVPLNAWYRTWAVAAVARKLGR